MQQNTARNFVVQLGSLISLYLSLSFLLVLLFGLINLTISDPADTVWNLDSAASSVRLGIAMVIVFFPTYVILTRMVNKLRRNEQDGTYLGLTKWLIYLSLLISGLVLLGDLVTVIMVFLEGEVTLRFALKALSVLVVIGAAFYYYTLDARGYWLENEKQSKLYGLGVSIIVAIIVISGFMNIETPAAVREGKIDDTEVSNLQDMQWRIENYLLTKGQLPETVEEAYNGIEIPTATEGRKAFEYTITEEGFRLCAEFATASKPDQYSYARLAVPPAETKSPYILNGDYWDHGVGYYCFERTVVFPDAN